MGGGIEHHLAVTYFGYKKDIREQYNVFESLVVAGWLYQQ